jgi:hypothetical protein
MTQKTSADLQKSPPPEYVPAEPHMAGREQGFPEEQVGRGRRQLTPVIETPTKLWTHIKATNRDGGLVKEALVRWARLVKPTSEDSESLLALPHQCSVPPQPLVEPTSEFLLTGPHQCSVPFQPVPRQHSVPFQPAVP